eukprot:10306075-Alexandrium_andersonii.AAC.1
MRKKLFFLKNAELKAQAESHSIVMQQATPTKEQWVTALVARHVDIAKSEEAELKLRWEERPAKLLGTCMLHAQWSQRSQVHTGWARYASLVVPHAGPARTTFAFRSFASNEHWRGNAAGYVWAQ